MDKVQIKVTLERNIWIEKEVWEGFGEEMPCDMEDLGMLQDEALTYETEIVKAEVVLEEN